MSDFYDITHDSACLCGFPCDQYRRWMNVQRVLQIRAATSTIAAMLLDSRAMTRPRSINV